MINRNAENKSLDELFYLAFFSGKKIMVSINNPHQYHRFHDMCPCSECHKIRRKTIYKRIKALIQNYSVYRTYDYVKASKSAVFLEPVVLPKELVEFLTKEPESTSEAKQIVEKVKQYSETAKEE